MAYIYSLNDTIADEASRLRKRYKKLETPDAIIAATAILNDLTLLTRNSKDFERVSNLKIRNPYDEKGGSLSGVKSEDFVA